MTTANDSLETGVNELAQAIAIGHIIDDLLPLKNEFDGITLFSFTDGWWKAGNPQIQDVGVGPQIVAGHLMMVLQMKNTGVS